MQKSTYYLLVFGFVCLMVWALLFYNRLFVKLLIRLGKRLNSQAAERGSEQFASDFVGFYELMHRPALWLGVASLALAAISGLLHQIA